MKFVVVLALLVVSVIASETIYISAFDPITKTIGQAYSSSGGNFWQIYVKNRGMIGEQASGLRGCPRATPRKLLEDGVNATEIAKIIQVQCGAYDQYRLNINTIDGDLTTVIAAQGCHNGNKICGTRNTTNFIVTGGGLRDGVLDAALNRWKQLDPKVSLTCRLYITLKAIYDAGGEVKPFRGASLTVDGLSMKEMFKIRARGTSNSEIFTRLSAQVPEMCKLYLQLLDRQSSDRV
jgi:hypothetical protein